MRRLAYLGAVVATVLALAPAALSKTQTAERGGITASFTFHGTTYNPTGQHLRITRGSAVLYDAAVRDPSCGSACAPGGYYGRSSIHIIDLDHTGVPDVLLDLSSGGAHCCFIEQVFAPGTSTSYKLTGDHNFFDYGATVANLAHDGHYEFVSGDERFAYAFAPFSDSAPPVQIWRWAGGRFTDVTAHFPHQIAADGRKWLGIYRGLARIGFQDSVGVIAAWAADEDRLGKHAAVDAYLTAQARARHLKASFPNHGGKRFIAKLDGVLRRYGYLT